MKALAFSSPELWASACRSVEDYCMFGVELESLQSCIEFRLAPANLQEVIVQRVRFVYIRTAPWTGDYLLRVMEGAWWPAYSS